MKFEGSQVRNQKAITAGRKFLIGKECSEGDCTIKVVINFAIKGSV